MSFNDLIEMKKTFKKPREGDVFVLQPIENRFYFGKVIRTDLKNMDSFINGMTLVYIYNYSSDKKEVPQQLEDMDFLIAPQIVNYQLWRKGYFETIANVEVLKKEKDADFAFWDVIKNVYVDINGCSISDIPKWRGIYGLGSYGSVGKEVQKAIKSI